MADTKRAPQEAATEHKRAVPRTYTALHIAVAEGDFNMVKKLVEGGADINLPNPQKETSLHYAFYHKMTDIAKYLLSKGGKPNKLTLEGCNCVHMCVIAESLDGLKILLDYCKEQNVSLNINQGNLYAETPLHYCATHNVLDCLKLLIAAGVELNSQMLTGETPLHLAQRSKHSTCVELLKKSGAKELPEPHYKFIADMDLPEFVSQAFLNDYILKEHENRFGGALWSKGAIQVFYTGKKPKVGLCVEVSLKLVQGKAPMLDTTMIGIISSVVGIGPQAKIIATVLVKGSHEEAFTTLLPGEWEVVLQFDPSKSFPWGATSLKPLQDLTKNYESLQTVAIANEKQYGRHVEIKADKVTPCQILKGLELMGDSHSHSHGPGHEHQIVDAVDVDTKEGTIVYTLDDGSKTPVVTGPKVPYLLNHILANFAQMMHKGLSKEQMVTIRIDGHVLDGNDLQFEEESDES